MAFLSLTENEIALLRFTCDLHFVEESPLWPLDARGAEPENYDAAYQSLVSRGVINEKTFRLNDDALNRIAPVTECDGRVVHIFPTDGGPDQADYYVLDEIAVRYLAGENTTHLFGDDFDESELVEHFARRVVPRRAVGDCVDFTLRPLEMLALSLLSPPIRNTGATSLSVPAARELLGSPPSNPNRQRAHTLETAFVPRVRPRQERRQTPRGDGVIGDEVWDEAIAGLLEAGVFRRDENLLVVRPAVIDLLRGLDATARHSFVRYDFGDDEWLVRETTLLPVDGSLFSLTQDKAGLTRIRELDGEKLLEVLTSAVGPLPRPDLDLDDETRTIARAEIPAQRS